MSPLLLPRRLASLLAIAIAMVCGSQSVHAGVITEPGWGDRAFAASAAVPSESPQRDTLRDASDSGMEGLPVSHTVTSQSLGLASSLICLADPSLVGRLWIIDRLLPDDPFLAGLPKPA